MQTSYERHQPHTQRKRKSRDLVYWKTPIANLDILLKGGFAQQTYLFYKTMKGGHGGAQLTFPASSEAEAGGSLGRQLRQHSKRQFETHRNEVVGTALGPDGPISILATRCSFWMKLNLNILIVQHAML